MKNSGVITLCILAFIQTVLSSRDGKAISCTSQSQMFWDHVWPFVKNARVINIMAQEDDSLDFSAQIMSCGVQQLVVPLTFTLRKNGSSETLQGRDKTVKKQGNTTSAIKNEGYIFSYYDRSTIARGMSKISKVSPDCKIILTFSNITTGDAEQLLKAAWSKYKILNLLIIRHSTEVLEASVLNPFQDGFVFNKILSEDTIKPLNNFIEQRLTYVHQYPLNICMFTYKGSAFPETYAKDNKTVTKYALKDGEIMDALVKVINFKPIYFEPADGMTYGYRMSNGTLTGSMAEVENRHADILGNMKPIKDLGQKRSGFLFPVDEMAFAFLTPKMGISSNVSFLRIFNASTSISLAAAYIVVLVSWLCAQLAHARYFKRKDKKSGIVDLGFIMFGAMLLISQKQRSLRYERCIFTGIVVFSMIICYHYQGKMVELLTNSKKSLDVNTVQDLAESGLFVMTVPSFRSLLEDIAMQGDDEAYKVLYTRQRISMNISEMVQRIGERKDAVMLTNEYSCQYFRSTMYDHDTGEDLFHVTQEGPPQRYSSHLAPDNSPYLERFYGVLMRIRESGLVLKWNQDDLRSLEVSLLQRRMKDGGNFGEIMEADRGVYKMRELSFVFSAHLTCCICCLIVFLGEIAVHARCH